jgi:Lipocalin-like domain
MQVAIYCPFLFGIIIEISRINLKQLFMKNKLPLLAILFVYVLFASCSSSKEARNFKSSINGKWQLQTVTTEGIAGTVKAQLLNEAYLNCFVGSSWEFNQNNSLGSYTISQNGGECVAVKRNFRWSVFESKDQPQLFQFKKVDNKYKEIDEGNAGYRFTILQSDKSTMQLRNDVVFEGKQASFIYNFVKI